MSKLCIFSLLLLCTSCSFFESRESHHQVAETMNVAIRSIEKEAWPSRTELNELKAHLQTVSLDVAEIRESEGGISLQEMEDQVSSLVRLIEHYGQLCSHGCDGKSTLLVSDLEKVVEAVEGIYKRQKELLKSSTKIEQELQRVRERLKKFTGIIRVEWSEEDKRILSDLPKKVADAIKGAIQPRSIESWLSVVANVLAVIASALGILGFFVTAYKAIKRGDQRPSFGITLYDSRAALQSTYQFWAVLFLLLFLSSALLRSHVVVLSGLLQLVLIVVALSLIVLLGRSLYNVSLNPNALSLLLSWLIPAVVVVAFLLLTAYALLALMGYASSVPHRGDFGEIFYFYVLPLTVIAVLVSFSGYLLVKRRYEVRLHDIHSSVRAIEKQLSSAGRKPTLREMLRSRRGLH